MLFLHNGGVFPSQLLVWLDLPISGSYIADIQLLLQPAVEGKVMFTSCGHSDVKYNFY
jgi:hypothetical protein